MDSFFVWDDGYTESHIIDAPGASLTFTYRPSVGGEVRYLFSDARDDEQERRICSFLATHVKTWNAKDGSGLPVKIEESVFAKHMRSWLRNAILDRITGRPEAAEADAKN